MTGMFHVHNEAHLHALFNRYKTSTNTSIRPMIRRLPELRSIIVYIDNNLITGFDGISASIPASRSYWQDTVAKYGPLRTLSPMTTRRRNV